MKLQSILAALCLLAAIAAYALTPHQRLAELEPINLEQMIPTQFSEWKMEPTSEAIISSPEQDAFVKSIYSQVLSRTYVNRAGERIMLSIAYTRDQSDNSGTQSHKPEICYPAQGFTIKRNQSSALQTQYGDIPIRQLVAEQGRRIEPLTYWTTVGNKVAVNGTGAKLAQLNYGLHGIITDGLIFRVSSIGEDIKNEYKAQNEFVNVLMTEIGSSARKKIAGL